MLGDATPQTFIFGCFWPFALVLTIGARRALASPPLTARHDGWLRPPVMKSTTSQSDFIQPVKSLPLLVTEGIEFGQCELKFKVTSIVASLAHSSTITYLRERFNG